MRQNKLYDNIPIIMVTAIGDNETFKESFNAGADDFVPKPINDVVLISRLTSQLEKHHMYQTLLEQSRFSAMDEVISMLAHQWRQPLGVINALTNNIRTKMELDSFKKSDITESFDKIESNLEQLSKMINDFKNSFSSIQTKECTSLVLTIDEVLELHQDKIANLHIKVNKKVEAIDSFLLAKQAIIQALAHLLKNCFDSFERCKVENPTIEISLKKVNNKVLLAMSDNGEGISEVNLPFIFEPYFTTKTERNGKGLGLYSAKQLVENQLMGELTLNSHNQKTAAEITITLDNLC
jgi:signal transduction histidine kinase